MLRIVKFVLVSMLVAVSLLALIAYAPLRGEAQQSGTAASVPKVATANSLESLLKESGLDYVKTKDGDCKVLVSVGEQSIMVYAKEVSLDAKEKYKLIYMYSLVVEVPTGFKHPQAMLKKIAEINDGLLVGKLGVNANDGNVWYSSSLWLRTADTESLISELIQALINVPDFRKEIKPFVKEE